MPADEMTRRKEGQRDYDPVEKVDSQRTKLARKKYRGSDQKKKLPK